MTSIILYAFMTAVSVTQTGNFEYGDDIYISGSGSYSNVSTFQLNTNALTNNGEINLSYINEYYNLTLASEYWFGDMAIITNSENYLAISTTLETSSDNVSWETLDVKTSIILADETPYQNFYGGYVVNQVSTGDYFATPSAMVNAYFRVSTTISYDNVSFDSDASTYGFMNGGQFTRNGLALCDYVPNYDVAYTNGYTDGYSIGYTKGTDEGYNNGYTDGYQVGYNNADDDEYSVKSLMFTILDYPLTFIQGAFNFEIFGINLLDIMTFIISMSLLGFIIKKVL